MNENEKKNEELLEEELSEKEQESEDIDIEREDLPEDLDLMDTVVTEEYNADAIQVLEGLEAVRKRPGMYIGSTGPRGLHQRVYEIVDNSIDEALAGFCTHIEVEILPGNVITSKDRHLQRIHSENLFQIPIILINIIEICTQKIFQNICAHRSVEQCVTFQFHIHMQIWTILFILFFCCNPVYDRQL